MRGMDVFLFRLPNSIPAQQNLDLMGERARIYCGISLSEYQALPGTLDWAEEGEAGIVCKCDVIAVWLVANQLDSVIEDQGIKASKARSK